jgi:hypothetical protein
MAAWSKGEDGALCTYCACTSAPFCPQRESIPATNNRRGMRPLKRNRSQCGGTTRSGLRRGAVTRELSSCVVPDKRCCSYRARGGAIFWVNHRQNPESEAEQSKLRSCTDKRQHADSQVPTTTTRTRHGSHLCTHAPLGRSFHRYEQLAPGTQIRQQLS